MGLLMGNLDWDFCLGLEREALEKNLELKRLTFTIKSIETKLISPF